MARLIHSETGVVVNVADEKVARMGPLFSPVDDKPAPKKAPAKAAAPKK